LAAQCGLCKRAIDIFVSAYGAEAGNLALKTLPFSGLYIAGGIAPKILYAMQEGHNFFNSFINKGRMQSVLEKVPVYVVVHKNVGLVGAQVLCRRQLKKQGFTMKGAHEHFHRKVPKEHGVDARTAAQVRANSDQLAITRCVNGVGVHFDLRDFKALRECFSDTVEVDYQSLSGAPAAPVKADQLMEAWRPVAQSFKSTQHMISNHLITVGQHEATCLSQVSATHYLPQAPGGEFWIVQGLYTHTLVRLEDGWRISKMKLTVSSIQGNPKLPEIAKGLAAKK